MAWFSVLWFVLSMASYTAYVYCDKCDRPLRKNEYRSEASPSDSYISITYYCKLCGSNARGFDCVAGIPGSLMAIVGLLRARCGDGYGDFIVFLQVHAVSCIFISALSLLEEVQMQTHLRPLGHAARPWPWQMAGWIQALQLIWKPEASELGEYVHTTKNCPFGCNGCIHSGRCAYLVQQL